MCNLLPLMLIVPIAFMPQEWEADIDPSDGMSYFSTAEDMVIEGIGTTSQRHLVEQLFVLSAVIDPHLRDSAILGLISIEHEEELVQKLLSMRGRRDQLLVPNVILASTVTQDRRQDSDEQLFAALSSIRKGRGISKNDAEDLRPWGFMFSQGIELFIQKMQFGRSISQEEIDTTLRVELAILGGATVWSADYEFTGGRPVALSANDDLATLMHVDPTKLVRKNGTWVVK